MKRFVLASCAIGIAACTSSTAPTAERAFELQLGHQTAVAGTPFLITFAGVIEDSRCPENAQCVWAGRLVVLTRLDGAGWRETPELVLGETYATHGTTVTLVSGTPEKRRDTETAPGDYRFVFEGGR